MLTLLRPLTASLCLLAPLTFTSVAAQGQPPNYRAGSLVIEAPWSRATPGNVRVASGYMRITNNGTESDRLISGTASVAGAFTVHETTTTDGVARMRHVESGLVIPPGQSVELSPGGLHVMLADLRQPLKEGDVVQGTLVFERAGTVAIAYRVTGVGAQSAGGPGQHHGH
jgi:periplasmic copper chaperone A